MSGRLSFFWWRANMIFASPILFQGRLMYCHRNHRNLQENLHRESQYHGLWGKNNTRRLAPIAPRHRQSRMLWHNSDDRDCPRAGTGLITEHYCSRSMARPPGNVSGLVAEKAEMGTQCSSVAAADNGAIYPRKSPSPPTKTLRIKPF